MKYLISIFTLISIQGNLFSFNKDSLKITQLDYKIEQLDNQAQEIRRDQINYRIEKDLLKETYSNNYDRISLIITIILGIIGVLGYLGIRDINTIKKEYSSELSNLKQAQTDIATKYLEFQTSKEKYDTELKDIFKTNEEQNKKIKVLELKDKISNLFKEKQYSTALEFCIVALELTPNDISLLHEKARINTRMLSYKDATVTYNKLLELDKNNQTAIVDLTEVYLLDKQQIEYQLMLSKHADVFNQTKNKDVLNLFSIIIHYQQKNLEKLKEISLSKIDTNDLTSKKSRIEGWIFSDMLTYIANESASEEKLIAQNLLWYLDGQQSASEFSTRTKIILPPSDKK